MALEASPYCDHMIVLHEARVVAGEHTEEA